MYSNFAFKDLNLINHIRMAGRYNSMSPDQLNVAHEKLLRASAKSKKPNQKVVDIQEGLDYFHDKRLKELGVRSKDNEYIRQNDQSVRHYNGSSSNNSNNTALMLTSGAGLLGATGAAAYYLNNKDNKTSFSSLNVLANFMQGKKHYMQAKQNIASGKSYTDLPGGQRKALRRERELSDSYMSMPKTPDNMYEEEKYPAFLLQNKRMQRQEDSKSSIDVLKRKAQLNDNYVLGYDNPGIKSRLESSDRFKNIEANPKYSIGTLNPLENDSRFLLTKRNQISKDYSAAETGRDYNRMSNDYKQLAQDYTPGNMPENLIEDMSQRNHIVPLYNDNLSYQGNFLRSKLGFNPTRVRKLKSGETPTEFLDIPSNRTIY